MNKNTIIIILAYANRYIYPFMILLLPMLGGKEFYLLVMGICTIFFAIYEFVGYKCKWKHIYCSYQDAYHQKMTPNNIRWHQVKKSDAYGIPLFCGVLGVAMIIIHFTEMF